MKVSREQLDKPKTIRQAAEFKWAKNLLKETEDTIDIIKRADNMDKVDLNGDKGTVVITGGYKHPKLPNHGFFSASLEYDPATGDVINFEEKNYAPRGDINIEQKKTLFGAVKTVIKDDDGKMTIDKETGMISIDLNDVEREIVRNFI